MTDIERDTGSRIRPPPRASRPRRTARSAPSPNTSRPPPSASPGKAAPRLTNILADLAVHITDASKGNADLYVAVDNTTVRSSATSVLTARGVNMSRVFFIVRHMDSIWMRDYGPRYIYQGQCRHR